MNARKSTHRKSMATILCGALLAVTSFGATAQSNATLADSDPVQATLMPTLRVTASATDPSLAQSWRLSPAKPARVTLMPAMTVGVAADALAVTTLPTVTVLASKEQAQVNPSVFVSVAALPVNNAILLAE